MRMPQVAGCDRKQCDMSMLLSVQCKYILQCSTDSIGCVMANLMTEMDEPQQNWDSTMSSSTRDRLPFGLLQKDAACLTYRQHTSYACMSNTAAYPNE